VEDWDQGPETGGGSRNSPFNSCPSLALFVLWLFSSGIAQVWISSTTSSCTVRRDSFSTIQRAFSSSLLHDTSDSPPQPPSLTFSCATSWSTGDVLLPSDVSHLLVVPSCANCRRRVNALPSPPLEAPPSALPQAYARPLFDATVSISEGM
jgi:hypothetical protein